MQKRVLVAEDHPDIRRLVHKAVTKAGFECTAVINGKEAVEAFKTEPFDLIIMDGSMPVMDGFEATKRIRSLEASLGENRSRIPIILHSALTGSEVTNQCRECGIDEFVPKSTMKELTIVVKRFLEK